MANAEVTRILGELERGRGSAADELLPLVYDELRAVAASLLAGERAGHTLQPTALVHEAYLRLVGETRSNWQGRAHFLAVAANAMRRILVNHARDRRAAKRGGGEWHKVSLTAVDTPAPEQEVDLVALDDALQRLEKMDERLCRVVELRFFGGLTVPETAQVLAVSDRTVELDWRMARSWLFKELSA
ncbi:MAG TPA: sigma-70 family RNA polymerase sigma factor [Phycisphaerae bacterium]|jgi:RNA polymerase sigma factor (TIGR02999 family)